MPKRDKIRKKNYTVRNKQTAARYLPCQCMVCGEMLDVLTHVHAQSHGYKDREEIIAAGYIRTLKYGQS